MLGVVLLLAAVAYVVFALVRSVPAARVVALPRSERFARGAVRLAWPSQGAAAIGVQWVGLIGVHGSRRPTPIASVAKVMTAYVVLREHPLHGAAGGPRIAVTQADVAAYRRDLAAGQSVVAVRAGERLTERQAVDGLLLPSGNNIAALLAGWAAPSESAFVSEMNATARALGLRDTHYADASGVRSATTSTAADQVRLAMRAMQIPAFRQPVAMTQATLPVAGRQYNKDVLLGRDGIIGIKTGTTSQAGGCFVFAARKRVGGRPVTIVGAVLHQMTGGGQPGIIAAAFHAATRLLASTPGVLEHRRIVRRGATVAVINPTWADAVTLTAARPASLIGWRGLRVRTTIATASDTSGPIKAGQAVGTAILAAGEQREAVPLIASRSMPAASLTWRLAHP